jgi:hypothetical protein
VAYCSPAAIEESLGFDASGIIGAVGSGISSALSTAAQIDARRSGQRLLSEGRSSMWSERLAEAQHRGNLAELEAQLRREEQAVLQEMEIEARQQRLDEIRAQQSQVAELRRLEQQAARGPSFRMPSWVWPVLGVGLIGGTFAVVAWRAGRS